jgi:hypothetical protein
MNFSDSNRLQGLELRTFIYIDLYHTPPLQTLHPNRNSAFPDLPRLPIFSDFGLCSQAGKPDLLFHSNAPYWLCYEIHLSNENPPLETKLTMKASVEA